MGETMSVTNLRTRQTCRPTLDQLAALWAMRILLNLGGHQQVVGQTFGEDSILKTVGLTHLSESSVPRRQWLKAFKARQRQLESAVSGLPAAGAATSAAFLLLLEAATAAACCCFVKS